MRKFIRQHKWHLVIFLILISVATTSGLLSYQSDRDLNPKPNTITNKSTIEIESTKPEENYPTKLSSQDTFLKVNEKKIPPKNKETPIETQAEITLVNNKADTDTEISETKTIPATLAINDTTYQLNINPGSSVYELMEEAKKTGLNYQTKNFGSGLGYFVEEINNIKQKPRENLYWIYYINGAKAQIGISNYIIQPNDLITWKYEEDENI